MAEETKTEELSDEAKLAQEALDATPEEPAEKPVKEDMVPATVVKTQRARARAAELTAARLQGENDALKATHVESVKSPIQLAREALKEDEVLEFTPELYEAQRKFEQSHATAQSEQEIYDRQKTDYEAGLSSFPEREELIAIGGHLLTDGDKRNIWDAGKNSGQELKRILNFRIEQDQPEEKTEKTDKSKAEEKAAVEKAAAEAKAKEEETPSQEEILSDEKLDEEYKKLTFA
jgi:hypothetical protein